MPNASTDCQLAACRTVLPLQRRMSGTVLEPIDYQNCILSLPLHNGLLQAEQPHLLTPAQAALAHAIGIVRGSAFAVHP